MRANSDIGQHKSLNQYHSLPKERDLGKVPKNHLWVWQNDFLCSHFLKSHYFRQIICNSVLSLVKNSPGPLLIGLFFKSKFHNEGSDWQKSYFEVFLAGIPLVTPKNFNLGRPPLHVFCPYLQDFWQISDADIFHWIFG